MKFRESVSAKICLKKYKLAKMNPKTVPITSNFIVLVVERLNDILSG